MKLIGELDGAEFTLTTTGPNPGELNYALTGAVDDSGAASVERISPDTFSVLLGTSSYRVTVVPGTGVLEVWSNSARHTITLADPRDRVASSKGRSASGPTEVRAQMPGRVIRILVGKGTRVSTGQGLIVVEAMKMQNEVKAPRDGAVTRIHVEENATVTAGECLVVIE